MQHLANKELLESVYQKSSLQTLPIESKQSTQRQSTMEPLAKLQQLHPILAKFNLMAVSLMMQKGKLRKLQAEQ